MTTWEFKLLDTGGHVILLALHHAKDSALPGELQSNKYIQIQPLDSPAALQQHKTKILLNGEKLNSLNGAGRFQVS